MDEQFAKKVKALLFVVFYSVLLFAGIHLFHFYFFKVKVVLYDSVLDAFLSVLISAFITYKRDTMLSRFEILLTKLLVLNSLVLYCILVPTVLDRSISLYLLRELDTQGQNVTISELEEHARRHYMDDMHVIEQRIKEQVVSGTIEIENEAHVRLTFKGKIAARTSRFYKTYLLKNLEHKL